MSGYQSNSISKKWEIGRVIEDDKDKHPVPCQTDIPEHFINQKILNDLGQQQTMENELIEEVDIPLSDLELESGSDEKTSPDAQDVLRCTYCEIEIATHFCRTCTDELCLSCRNFHVKSKVPFGHEIITIKEKHEDGTRIEKCLIHENSIYFACCVECKLPVCTECMKTKHNGHSIVDISQIWNEEKEKAETILSQLRENITTENNAISSAREGMFQIGKWFEDRRERYKKEGELLKEKVDRMVIENIERSKEDERQQNGIYEEIEEKNINALKDLISKYEDQISKGHPAELLVFLKGHTPNPAKTDIYPRFPALNIQDPCTIKLQHQPDSACCAESFIKIKKTPLNEIEWINVKYLDAPKRQFQCNGNILVVVSIVIGTNKSCAAVSFRPRFQTNQLKIVHVSSTAESVLHIKNGDIIHAEETEERTTDPELLNCSLLKEMKITDSLIKDSTIEAEDGSVIQFSKFYTKIIDFWRKRVLTSFEEKNTMIIANDILWVLPMPPPWDSTSEGMLLDYLIQENIENYCILTSETAILRYCECDYELRSVKILNDKHPVKFSEGDSVIIVQSEEEFTDFTSAIVLEDHSISPTEKKRDRTLSPKTLEFDYFTKICEKLEMTRKDLDNLIETDDFFESFRRKCRLSESELQHSRQRVKFQFPMQEKNLDKPNLSKLVSKNGPILSIGFHHFVPCQTISTLLQNFTSRLSSEIRMLSSYKCKHIIVVGKFASWPMVLDNLRHSFPSECILASSDFHSSIITIGSIVHGHMKRI